ncbi:unnamed protein product [Cylindrotheca closterium]|uniref:GPI-anchor transamidase n=1 Tax=Cylindrotheca closterium TaxID=2856 RepID=A0AAD2FUB9_9STRA|nr:unnamed protein product [Cylindrotheca closterium]
MIADEYVTNNRNPLKNGMFANGVDNANWYDEHTEIDFRGSDVNVQNFIDAMLGTSPRSIQSNSNSSLLVYVTGHGGDQFFKFQDEEEITSQDIANLMDKLNAGKKFGKALLIADTCQAFTLFDKVETPNVLSLGTSLRGENAYAHHSDHVLGLSVIERWTNGFVNQYSRSNSPKSTLSDLMVAPFPGKAVLGAHVGIKENAIRFKDVLASDFFGPRKSKKMPPKMMKSKSLDQANEQVAQIDTASKPAMETSEVKRSLAEAERESFTRQSSGINEGTHDGTRQSLYLESADLVFVSVLSALVSIILAAKVIEKRDTKI